MPSGILFLDTFQYADGALTGKGPPVVGTGGWTTDSATDGSLTVATGVVIGTANELRGNAFALPVGTNLQGAWIWSIDVNLGGQGAAEQSLIFCVGDGNTGPVNEFIVGVGNSQGAGKISLTIIDAASTIQSGTPNLANQASSHNFKLVHTLSPETLTVKIDDVAVLSLPNSSSVALPLRVEIQQALDAATVTFPQVSQVEFIVPPATPTGLAAGTPTTTTVPLTWNTSTDATGYRIYSSVDGYTTPIYDGATAATTITGLTPNTLYHFKVSAYNTAGESALSTAVDATTLLGVILNLVAVKSGIDVVLTWTAFAGTDHYKISKDGGAYGSNQTSPYTDAGAAGSPHTYTVRAYDASGNVLAQATASYVLATGGMGAANLLTLVVL